MIFLEFLGWVWGYMVQALGVGWELVKAGWPFVGVVWRHFVAFVWMMWQLVKAWMGK